MSSKNEDKKVLAVMIIEVMGRPENFLIETLEDLSKQISEEKGVKLISKKINEPHLVKDQKDLFTSFAEVEVEVEDAITVSGLMFKYMPSHIEIIEPENFVFKNFEFSEMLTEITRRIHKYEELVKVLQFDLERQAKAGPQKVLTLKEAVSQSEASPEKKEFSDGKKEKSKKKIKK